MSNLTFDQLPQAVSELHQKLDNIERLLLATNKSHDSEKDIFLTIKEAAGILNLSVPTIYTLVSKSDIPVNKRGKRLYFCKHELIEWVKQGRKNTSKEIEEAAINNFISVNKTGGSV